MSAMFSALSVNYLINILLEQLNNHITRSRNTMPPVKGQVSARGRRDNIFRENTSIRDEHKIEASRMHNNIHRDPPT
jgi:hypothetical protein